MYKIEKNIPAPQRTINNFPLSEMDINDSFLVPKEKRSSVQVAIRKYMNLNQNTSFVTKTLEDGTFRIWRTA